MAGDLAASDHYGAEDYVCGQAGGVESRGGVHGCGGGSGHGGFVCEVRSRTSIEDRSIDGCWREKHDMSPEMRGWWQGARLERLQ